MHQAVFLPGAGGLSSFWAPAARLLAEHEPDQVLLDWPGFGAVPGAPAGSIAELVAFTRARLQPPAHLIAQSMGCVVALLLALEFPAEVGRLVLCGASGGLDMKSFGAADWRGGTGQAGPTGRGAFESDRTDLSNRLAEIEQPVLLLRGGEDRLSPLAAGHYLAAELPRAELRTFPGVGHDLPFARPEEVALAVAGFLYSAPGSG